MEAQFWTDKYISVNAFPKLQKKYIYIYLKLEEITPFSKIPSIKCQDNNLRKLYALNRKNSGRISRVITYLLNTCMLEGSGS